VRFYVDNGGGTTAYYQKLGVGRYEKVKGNEITWIYDDPNSRQTARKVRWFMEVFARGWDGTASLIGMPSGDFEPLEVKIVDYFDTYFIYKKRAFAVVPWRYENVYQKVKGEWRFRETIIPASAKFRPGPNFQVEARVIESRYAGTILPEWYGGK
jgi:hypothetical protein